MLVSTKEVANRLKISNRAVQIKCKRAGLVKIGNQYQITKDIAESWYNETKDKSEQNIKRTEHTTQISHPKRKNIRSFTSFVLFLFIMISIVLAVLFYINLDTQINDYKTIIIVKDKEHSTEIKDLNKRLNDAKDIIHNQDLEIQILKYKDSIRKIKKW